MKKLFLTLAFGSFLGLQAQNYEISTLRIGDFKLYQSKTEADKIAKKTIDENSDWEHPDTVNYFGENIEIVIADNYISQENPSVKSVYSLKTKSKKFRTKSGMGVGNTRDELLDTYRNYPNFHVTRYPDPNNPNIVESYFSLDDNDAASYLSFKMENNVVTEISVGINEGC